MESHEPVVVIERISGAVLKGEAAPTRKVLVKWLIENPTYEVFPLGQPTKAQLLKGKSVSFLSGIRLIRLSEKQDFPASQNYGF